jgi:hypothetical protein
VTVAAQLHGYHPDDVIEMVEWEPCGRTMLVRVARDRYAIHDYAAGEDGEEVPTDLHLDRAARGRYDLVTAAAWFRETVEYLEETQGFERKAVSCES